MEPAVRVRCNDCGQMIVIEKHMILARGKPKFCPYCGHTNLTTFKSSFDWNTAPCFAGIPGPLVQAIFEKWARNLDNEQDKYRLFVDYLHYMLEEGEL